MSLLAASTLQVLAFVLALLAAGIAGVRGVRLARQSVMQLDSAAWWQSEPARKAIGHAVRPLWWTIAALLVGAVLPKLALLMADT
ncbi:hypothetical protein ABFU27_11325 [Xanthomonas campestris pv. raphani]|uniref:hypothetical protein n=1 Tax=Xanthomonas campestris TaxID=339 RepID=UPI0013795D82|nr:hypothetical protein [Xanthomonas campestris]MCC8687263.1 hypothetical protein [Xanthomonas campestris]MCC8691260.1 hypothetical protein [Xanthomonas campestris]MCW1997953.1 Mn2+/Fe2+ NRAMP family transporter [Xanthomonas campestris]MEA9605588.1 hypothetical protein [Xanthomonas campestris pv. plantaginis]MEA9677320.1 hypothetical protein [Xanthomonas campestris pv. raphani]